jgi:hypothetical protein
MFKYVIEDGESNGVLCLTVRLVWDVPVSSKVKHCHNMPTFTKHRSITPMFTIGVNTRTYSPLGKNRNVKRPDIDSAGCMSFAPYKIRLDDGQFKDSLPKKKGCTSKQISLMRRALTLKMNIE